MARYHLHARLFAGSLDAPTRNELQTASGDDQAAMETVAWELAARGFHVWVYDDAYRVVGEWRPKG